MKLLLCRCSHPQGFHAKGAGACRCGCEEFNPWKSPLDGVEVLALVVAGDPPWHAPTYRVQCKRCGNVYETRCWLREIAQRRSCVRCKLERRRRKKKPGAGSSRPRDMPAPEVFASRHGTRSAYVAGCRCEPCAEANRSYARMRDKMARDGKGNPLVDASRARKHIERLSAAGVGYKTVADLAGIPTSSAFAIRSGAKPTCRRETERKILAVSRDALTDAKLVDASSTWKKLEWMLEQGFTRQELARRLGNKGNPPALRVRRDRVTAKTRAKVERLYSELRG